MDDSVLVDCESVGGVDAAINQAFHSANEDIQFSDATCPTCDAAVLDEIGLMTSCCIKCTHIWMTNKMLNPLAKYIKVDFELLDKFDVVFERIG